MSGGTYLAMMRSASVILFALSIIIVVGTLVSTVLAYRTVNAEPGYQQVLQEMQWSQLLNMLIAGLEGAAMPFLGAAALWRADVWLRRGALAKTAEAAE